MADTASPDSVARRNDAIAAYHRGEPDALDRVSQALKDNPHDGGLLISQAALLIAHKAAKPLDHLEAILRRAPDWVDGHVALAGFRWELGDTESYLAEIEAAIERMPRHAGLWKNDISLLAGSGELIGAADAAQMARKKGFDMPMLRLIEAMHSGAAGDLDRAGALLADLPRELPDLPQQLARHHLRTGSLEAALSELDEARHRHPDDISNWALTELAWRLASDKRHAWLTGEGSLYGPRDLGISDTDLAELANTLRELHATGAAPIGQSVRSGTQTRGDLFRRIEPPIRHLRDLLADAVAGFWQDLPRQDHTHPLLRHRAADPEFVTGWSIRILDGGFHVSHVHPEGILSSAFYVVVPDRLDHSEQQGWIELGRAPADLMIDNDPLVSFEPRAGRLVLFPSYLYHGTRPFPAGERMSVAFDIAPARKASS